MSLKILENQIKKEIKKEIKERDAEVGCIDISVSFCFSCLGGECFSLYEQAGAFWVKLILGDAAKVSKGVCSSVIIEISEEKYLFIISKLVKEEYILNPYGQISSNEMIFNANNGIIKLKPTLEIELELTFDEFMSKYYSEKWTGKELKK